MREVSPIYMSFFGRAKLVALACACGLTAACSSGFQGKNSTSLASSIAGSTAPAAPQNAEIANLSVDGAATVAGSLTLTGKTPTLTSTSPLQIPGGANFSSGPVTVQAALEARGGIANDSAPVLKISGGTSGATYFPNNTGLGTATPNALLEVAQSGSQPALSVGDGGTDDGASYGMVNLTRPADATRAHLAFIRSGNYVWQTGYVQNTNTLGFFPWNFSGAQGTPTLSLSGPNVGIGTASPNATLAVNGNGIFTQSVTAPNFTMTSDSRLKKEITSLSSELDRVLTLRPVHFEWNDVAHARGVKDRNVQLGFIAQEIEKSYPEAVATGDDGYKSVNYQALLAPVVQAMKEMHAQNVALEKRVEELEKKLAAQSAGRK